MNINNFEQTINSGILARGKKYFEEGAVISIEQKARKWAASIKGSKIYHICLNGQDEFETWECDCPFIGPACKHVAAAMYALQGISKMGTGRLQLSVDDFEEAIDEEILRRGKNYYKDGAVSDLQKKADKWTSKVKGSQVYKIILDGNDPFKSWSCDCPFQKGPVCKHVTATLFAIKEKQLTTPAPTEAEPATEREELDVDLKLIFENTEPDKLIRFLKKEVHTNEVLKDHLLKEFKSAYQLEEDNPFEMMIDAIILSFDPERGEIDAPKTKALAQKIKQTLKKSETYIANGNFLDSFQILDAVLKHLPSVFSRCDFDSLYNCIEISFDQLDTLLQSIKAFDLRERIVNSMYDCFLDEQMNEMGFEQFPLKLILNHYQDIYSVRILEKLISPKIQQLNKQLKAGKNVDHRFLTTYIQQLADVYDKEGMYERRQQFLNKYIHLIDVRKLVLYELMEDKNLEKAKTVILDGINIAEQNNNMLQMREWKNFYTQVEAAEKVLGR